MSESEKIQPHKQTVWIMVAVIVLFLVGIACRWDYVKTEVKDSVFRILGKEQVDSVRVE